MATTAKYNSIYQPVIGTMFFNQLPLMCRKSVYKKA